MSSESDSEDDCYGNAAKKLQTMKAKFDRDVLQSNFLDDSVELNEDKNNSFSDKFESKPKTPPVEYDPESPVYELPDVSQEIVVPNHSKRVTRSSARRKNTTPVSNDVLPAKRSRKKKSAPVPSLSVPSAEPSAPATILSVPNAESIAPEPTAPPVIPSAAPRGRKSRGRGCQTENAPSPATPSRGRGRGNRSRGRGRRSRQTMFDYFASIFPSHNNIPTYSIGNTDEYTDQSNNQPLFSKPKTTEADEVVIVEEDNLENEELSVKVYWQSTEFFKFTIRRYQKLAQIFDYFAKKENVNYDNLLLTYNEKVLKPDDTPDSIKYSIVKFIEGGITNDSVSKFMSTDTKGDGIKLKFQCQNVKKPLEVTIHLDEKMSVAMMKCAEHLEKPLEKLKFEFDGDCISGKSTARELELEGGECIDVKICS